MLKRLLGATGLKKTKATYILLGYGPQDLIQKLECQFKPGMSWENRELWHIDHRKPIKAFLDQGQFNPRVINALCNLRPMWAKDNISKGAKWKTS